MIRHCVLFKWKPEVDSDHIQAVSAALDGLAQLPVVAAFTHGTDAGLREGSFDYAVVADFEGADAWAAYQADEGHQRLIAELLVPFIEQRAGIQFELPSQA